MDHKNLADSLMLVIRQAVGGGQLTLSDVVAALAECQLVFIVESVLAVQKKTVEK